MWFVLEFDFESWISDIVIIIFLKITISNNQKCIHIQDIVFLNKSILSEVVEHIIFYCVSIVQEILRQFVEIQIITFAKLIQIIGYLSTKYKYWQWCGSNKTVAQVLKQNRKQTLLEISLKKWTKSVWTIKLLARFRSMINA